MRRSPTSVVSRREGMVPEVRLMEFQTQQLLCRILGILILRVWTESNAWYPERFL
jgi:hypothetical protein